MLACVPRAGLTPDLLVQEAVALLDDDGAAALTLSALARRCGITTAGIYAHVQGLADLRERVAAACLSECADRVGAAIAGRSGAPALHAFADAYRDYARTHPGRYDATRWRVTDPASPAVPAGRRHAELARAVLRAHDLPEPALTHAVRLLGSTIHGFLALEASGSFDHSPPAAAESWSAILDALAGTVTAWGQSQPAGAASSGNTRSQ